MKAKFSAVLVGLAGLAFGGSAAANVLILDPAPNLYQQTAQSPCIFSNPPCASGTAQNGFFLSTNLDTGGNVSGYDALSPVYSGATLLGIAGTPMLLGIDINQGGSAQTLTTFEMLVNGFVVDTYTGSAGNVPDTANGTGWSDYTLRNFSSFLSTDTVQFHFVFNNANDGTENVFLIGANVPPCTVNCGPIPEPMSLALFGIGALGFALARRRKQQS